MTKTLADMTPEERDQCVGMWCDTPRGTFVLFKRMFEDVELGWSLIMPKDGFKVDYPNSDITPRFDLPRAWNPDGSPLQATRETITGFDGMYLDAPGGGLFLTSPGTIYQRWIIDWQEVE